MSYILCHTILLLLGTSTLQQTWRMLRCNATRINRPHINHPSHSPIHAGAPSLVSTTWTPLDLLGDATVEAICADLTAPPTELAVIVEVLLGDWGRLGQVGRHPARVARNWTEGCWLEGGFLV